MTSHEIILKLGWWCYGDASNIFKIELTNLRMPFSFITLYGILPFHTSMFVQYGDVTWASWCLKSSATRFSVQQLAQAPQQTKTKYPHYWIFARGIHRSPVDSPHKGPVMEVSKRSHNMTPSCCMPWRPLSLLSESVFFCFHMRCTYSNYPRHLTPLSA